MAKHTDPNTSLRKYRHKALAIASLLFEAQGYHPRSLREIEEFIGTTTANPPARHVKSTEEPQAFDEDT